MIPYILVFLVLLIPSYIFDMKGRIRGYNGWWYFALVLLIAFAGIRYHIGGDTVHYERHFKEWPPITEWSHLYTNFSDKVGYLWFLINCTLKSIWDNFIIMQLFHAVLFNVLLFRFIKKTTPHRFLAVLFIYCITWWNLSFEVIRESLCVVIFLNSLFAIKQKKVLLFLLINIPCVFIHVFSIFPILLALAFYFINIKSVLVVLVSFLMVCFMVDETSINENIIFLLVNMGDITSELGIKYLESSNYGYSYLNIFGILKNVILSLGSLFVSLHLYKNNRKFESKLILLYLLFFIGTAKLTILHRFENYLLPFIIIETLNYLVIRSSISKHHYLNKNFIEEKGLGHHDISINGNYQSLQGYKSPQTHIKNSSQFAYIITLLVFSFTVINSIKEFYLPAWGRSEGNVNYDYRYIPYKTIFQDPDPIRESFYMYY